MKLKNLFLTSLVALALGACSSSDDSTANVNAQKNAVLGFSIAMPTSTSRATAEGTASEQNVDKVEISVVQGTPANYSFTYVAGTDNGASQGDFTYANGVYTLKSTKLIPVTAGTADVYVTINGQQAIATDLNFTDGKVASGYAATNANLADIEATGNIAAPNEFLMSGKTKGATIVADQVNTVTVNVDRVAAKVEELSSQNLNTYKFTTTVYDAATESKYVADENTSVNLKAYSFINLNKTSNIYAQTNMLGFDATAADGFNWASAKVSDATNDILWSSLSNKAISKTNASDAAVNNGITYMMENENAAYPTYVVYQAKIVRNGEEVNHDCFTYTKTVTIGGTAVKKTCFYNSFDELNADNANMFSGAYQLKSTSTYDEFAAAGVEKYSNGVCYYSKKIETGTDTFKVVRNNWYKLTVNNIANLGYGEIDNDNLKKTTLLDVMIIVNRWTLNTQSINF